MPRHWLIALAAFLHSAAWAEDCEISRGRQTFANKCGICHSAEAGAEHIVGPNLHGISGRPQGRAPGFSYSDALNGATGHWDDGRLNDFLKAPQKALPGTAMPFQGLKSESERRHLICFLNTLK